MKKISWRIPEMLETKNQNGMKKISWRSSGKISFAASGDPVYPSEALIEAITEIFRNVSPDCVQNANDAIAENPNIEREELIDILTQPGCFEEDSTLDEEGARRNLLSWSIANPGKAAALGIGITATAVATSWLIGHLVKKSKIKRRREEATQQLGKIQRISDSMSEPGHAFYPDPVLSLTEAQMKEISNFDPALVAMDPDGNVRVEFINYTRHNFRLLSIDVESKYYLKGFDVRKPYVAPTQNVTISSGDLGSKDTEIPAYKRRPDSISLRGAVVKTTSPERGSAISLTPTYAYLGYYTSDGTWSNTRVKIVLNKLNYIYTIDTAQM